MSKLVPYPAETVREMLINAVPDGTPHAGFMRESLDATFCLLHELMTNWGVVFAYREE